MDENNCQSTRSMLVRSAKEKDKRDIKKANAGRDAKEVRWACSEVCAWGVFVSSSTCYNSHLEDLAQFK